MNRARLTPLGKIVVLVLALSLGGLIGAAGANAFRPDHQSWRCVVAAPGETVWDLAGGGQEDVRKTVLRIVDRNDLQGSPLSAGAAVWVPVEVPAAERSTSPEACRDAS